MKKLFLYVVWALTVLLASSCKEETPDYGSLTIDDIAGLAVGESRDIVATFSKPEYAGEIAYAFSGQAISIADNRVTALVGGETVAVTARTEHHVATFTVSTVEALASDDVLHVPNVDAWVGYPASEIFPTINGEAADRPVHYAYDATKLTIDTAANVVWALEAGQHAVTASVGGGVRSFIFTVNAREVDRSGDKYDTAPYDAYAQDLQARWQQDGTDGMTTLFIGDSFFDVRSFWTDFYATYWGKDALCFGIGATTTYDWEQYLNGWLGELQPRNVVMHIGTNNVYDDLDDAATATLSLQRMFTLMHGMMPGTRVYYFGISQRAYDAAKQDIVAQVNEQMQAWCARRSWITYIDTPSQLTADMLKDGIHPKLEYYHIFTDALAETDIVMADKAVTDEGPTDITRTVDQAVANGASSLLYKGSTLANNYVLEGKMDFTATATNPHLCISFKAGDYFAYRMLLWDVQSTGTFRVGYAYNGAHNDGVADSAPSYQFTAGQTLTLDFKLAYVDNNAYLWLNGDFVLAFVNATGTGKPESLSISSENLACRIYDMTAVTQAADGQAYTDAVAAVQETIAAYAGQADGAHRP